MMSSDEEQDPFDVDPEFQFTGDRKRLRKLTPKAQEEFTQSVLHKLSTLGKCWAEILQLTNSVSKSEKTETNAHTSISILEQQFTVYTQLSNSFIDFLERTRTEESLGLKNEHLDEYQQQKQLVELTLYKLNTMLASVSEMSPNSSYGGTGSIQSKAANARAKAEAAKARLSFMEKEAKLKQQKAVIETKLDVIAAEKDAAVAVAEADALDAYGSSRRSRNTFFASEITKLLLKKDLLFASLTTFNDSPENYQSWKCSFKDKMKELSVTPLEEMDLLTKWTGATSKQQVIALRSAYFNAPSKGVREIWKRLDERFGSPDVIESSLKKRLTNFPKLSSKDTQKLYELADILTEIEAVKSDTRYSSVLAYFDSSTGVSPVVI
ncbi:uncharacterized protein LOC130013558 [Patella vulgata]|uniref:uncharacterized protein LOC130013558 n=1 Tax=Patella vulgata TaxID=6465 RepID=UPI0024A7DBFF|nr:uncharacterized protein LOC130013558 [Patella vulgata]